MKKNKNMKEKEKDEEIFNLKINHIRKRTSGETFRLIKILIDIANDEGLHKEEETILSTGCY